MAKEHKDRQSGDGRSGSKTLASRLPSRSSTSILSRDALLTQHKKDYLAARSARVEARRQFRAIARQSSKTLGLGPIENLRLQFNLSQRLIRWRGSDLPDYKPSGWRALGLMMSAQPSPDDIVFNTIDKYRKSSRDNENQTEIFLRPVRLEVETSDPQNPAGSRMEEKEDFFYWIQNIHGVYVPVETGAIHKNIDWKHYGIDTHSFTLFARDPDFMERLLLHDDAPNHPKHPMNAITPEEFHANVEVLEGRSNLDITHDGITEGNWIRDNIVAHDLFRTKWMVNHGSVFDDPHVKGVKRSSSMVLWEREKETPAWSPIKLARWALPKYFPERKRSDHYCFANPQHGDTGIFVNEDLFQGWMKRRIFRTFARRLNRYPVFAQGDPKYAQRQFAHMAHAHYRYVHPYTAVQKDQVQNPAKRLFGKFWQGGQTFGHGLNDSIGGVFTEFLNKFGTLVSNNISESKWLSVVLNVVVAVSLFAVTKVGMAAMTATKGTSLGRFVSTGVRALNKAATAKQSKSQGRHDNTNPLIASLELSYNLANDERGVPVHDAYRGKFTPKSYLSLMHVFPEAVSYDGSVGKEEEWVIRQLLDTTERQIGSEGKLEDIKRKLDGKPERTNTFLKIMEPSGLTKICHPNESFSIAYLEQEKIEGFELTGPQKRFFEKYASEAKPYVAVRKVGDSYACMSFSSLADIPMEFDNKREHSAEPSGSPVNSNTTDAEVLLARADNSPGIVFAGVKHLTNTEIENLRGFTTEQTARFQSVTNETAPDGRSGENIHIKKLLRILPDEFMATTEADDRVKRYVRARMNDNNRATFTLDSIPTPPPIPGVVLS